MCIKCSLMPAVSLTAKYPSSGRQDGGVHGHGRCSGHRRQRVGDRGGLGVPV